MFSSDAYFSLPGESPRCGRRKRPWWPLWRVVTLSVILWSYPSPFTSHFMLFSFEARLLLNVLYFMLQSSGAPLLLWYFLTCQYLNKIVTINEYGGKLRGDITNVFSYAAIFIHTIASYRMANYCALFPD